MNDVSPIHTNPADELARLRARIAELEAAAVQRTHAQQVQQAIYRISQATLVAPELEDLYEAIHHIIAELMPARNFYITLYDPATDLFYVPYAVDELEHEWVPYAPGKGLGAYVLRTGQPLLATPEVFKQLEQAGEAEILAHRMIDWMGVPLRTQQGIIGVMAVQTYTEAERLTDDDLDVLVFVSTQVAMAIERKQAERAIQHYALELERRVEERTAELETALKELEGFSYSVSHDLRGPLRAIDGYARLLLLDHTGQLNDEGKEFLRRVCQASQRMGQLIDDLLQLSRLTRQEIVRQPVNLSKMAREIVDQLERDQPERRGQVQVAGDLREQADTSLLHVALENLLNNAWKFTRQARQPRIEFGGSLVGGVPTFYVRDNGAGFDMKYKDKLFQPFQRLHHQDEFEGNGIGLATVKRIIERHGGRVWAEGGLGQGACFYFTLR
ncbi:MAG: sensor histidine kinase [Chloroflexota bacterium]